MALGGNQYVAKPGAGCCTVTYGDWRQPEEVGLQHVTAAMMNVAAGVEKGECTPLAYAFRRNVDNGNGLEVPGGQYCYLVRDGMLHFGDAHLGGLVMTEEHVRACRSPQLWRERGPQATANLFPTGISLEEKGRILNARRVLLDHAVTIFEELGVMEKVTDFLSGLYGQDVTGAVTLQELFARYYVHKGKDASLGLTAEMKEIFKSKEQVRKNQDYPVHIDPHFATLVMTLPSLNYKTNGGMKVKVYDPKGIKSRDWGNRARIDESQEVGEDLESDGDFLEFAVHPFSFSVFANPLLHSVTRLMSGERLSIIAFFGVEY